MIGTNNGLAVVDFRRLKAAVTRLLPAGDPVREAVLQEPDHVPADLALGKADVYLRLLKGRQTR